LNLTSMLSARHQQSGAVHAAGGRALKARAPREPRVHECGQAVGAGGMPPEEGIFTRTSSSVRKKLLSTVCV